MASLLSNPRFTPEMQEALKEASEISSHMLAGAGMLPAQEKAEFL
jgi:hypothetical protein